jgi:hypothetical protein
MSQKIAAFIAAVDNGLPVPKPKDWKKKGGPETPPIKPNQT